ncbi:unnamed protein product [Vitrella brassicaformis CCMP3155]|uniref:Uncharacterized protein n=2 Tax=Vitrella brassicaformis TaxID=1169539 RepID=A0A0G4F4J1_VITBC|nr:unnamed protein product [Vitrella brassicaformis CCMP3155]|eukprot:CEM06816.1 unnamed protein product [Vitrella brassicaformis CCMP3155]
MAVFFLIGGFIALGSHHWSRWSGIGAIGIAFFLAGCWLFDLHIKAFRVPRVLRRTPNAFVLQTMCWSYRLRTDETAGMLRVTNAKYQDETPQPIPLEVSYAGEMTSYDGVLIFPIDKRKRALLFSPLVSANRFLADNSGAVKGHGMGLAAVYGRLTYEAPLTTPRARC